MSREIIEPKIGEVFEFEGQKAKCVKDRPTIKTPCKLCCFLRSGWCHKIMCTGTSRYDGKEVHFIEVD